MPCAAWFVDFHANGRLEMAAIARSCVVRGWELGPHDTLYLRDTGALDLVHLHPPQTRLGGPLTSRHGEVPTRSLVELDDRGELTTAFVGGPCTLGGTDFEANDSVDFTGVAPEKRAGAWTFASIPS